MRDRLVSLLSHPDKFFSIGDSALLSLSRLFVTIALARLLDTDSFAQCLLLLAAAVILLSVAQSWFTTPLIHLAGKGMRVRTSMNRWAMQRIHRLMLLVVAVGATGYVLYFHRYVEGATYGAFLLSLLAGLQVQHERACRQAEFESAKVFYGDFLGLCSHAGVFLIGWLVFGSIQLSFWLGMTLNSWIAVWVMRGSYSTVPLKAMCQTEEISALQKGYRHMGNMMVLGSLATTISSRLHPFLLASVSSSLSVAQLGVVMTLVGPIRMVSVALNVLLRPRLSRLHETGETGGFKRLVGASIVALLLGGLLGVVIALLFERVLIETLFGTKWDAALGLLPFAVVYATLDAVTTCLMVALQTGYRGGTRHTTIARGIAAGVTISSVVPLCSNFGAFGALLSLLLAETVYLIYSLWVIARTGVRGNFNLKGFRLNWRKVPCGPGLLQ